MKYWIVYPTFMEAIVKYVFKDEDLFGRLANYTSQMVLERVLVVSFFPSTSIAFFFEIFIYNLISSLFIYYYYSSFFT